MSGRTLFLLLILLGTTACSSLQTKPDVPAVNIAEPNTQRIEEVTRVVSAITESPFEVVFVPKAPESVKPTLIAPTPKSAPAVAPAVPKKIEVSRIRVKKTLEKKWTAADAKMATVEVPLAKPKVVDNRINWPPSAQTVKKDWRSTVIPTGMLALVDTVKNVLSNMWPTFKMPSFLMAMIEQETCISPTSKRCGSTRAELKTDREYGFGFIQFTIAKNKDGSERFNVWKELKGHDPQLEQKWTWENRFDPELQMRAAVIKNKMNYSSVKFTTIDEMEKMAFTAVTNNSGSPLTDRRLCIAKGPTVCDPARWFDTTTIKGVESFSTKSRVAAKGYGQTFFDISREYPRMLIYVRREKYINLVDPHESKK